jgi:hypothetical protein
LKIRHSLIGLKLSVVGHACNPSTHEVEAGESRVPRSHIVRPWLQKKKTDLKVKSYAPTPTSINFSFKKYISRQVSKSQIYSWFAQTHKALAPSEWRS